MRYGLWIIQLICGELIRNPDVIISPRYANPQCTPRPEGLDGIYCPPLSSPTAAAHQVRPSPAVAGTIPGYMDSSCVLLVSVCT